MYVYDYAPKRILKMSTYQWTIPQNNYGSETVIPLYITGCKEKIYSESTVVAKRRRLIGAIYFLTTAGDIKRYHRLRTIISLVSGFFVMLCACCEANEILRSTYGISYSHSISNSQSTLRNITTLRTKK